MARTAVLSPLTATLCAATRLALLIAVCIAAHVAEAQTMSTRADLSRLQLRGDGREDDSVSLAVVAAARLLGRDADYQTVFCQSANAFAPSIDLAEDCTAHWHVCAWHALDGLPAVARRLGLRIERLTVPESASQEGPAPAADEPLRRYARAIAAAMERGQVVLTPGGWEIGFEPPGPHGFVHWGYMGVVTQVDTSTGVILGAHLNGFADNLISSPAGLWGLGVGDAPLAAEQADLEMLRQAVDRIRSQGAFARTCRVANGLEAMDAWIRQMRTVRGFCAPCYGRGGASSGDAADNALRTAAGSRAAAAQLRRIAGRDGGAAGPLESAARRYDRIDSLLSPAVSGTGGGRYADLIGDLARQEAHADAVLVPVRAELAAIADDLEQAVLAMAVGRADGRTWVEGVPVAPGDGNGYIRGLEAILAQQGAPVAYDRLMAWSGLAFIAQADAEHRWEGKVDVGWWPLDPWGLALRRQFLAQAIGFELHQVGPVAPTVDQVAAVRADPAGWYRGHVQPSVERSLDAGQPVLCLDEFGYVITGYDAAADQPPVFGHCARDLRPGEGRPDWWPSAALVLGRRTAVTEARAADIAALRYAVELARDQAGPYEAAWRDRRFTGQKTYAAWAALLRDPSEPVEDRHHANMKGRLLDARWAAVRYLGDLAAREPGAAAARLLDAAAAYEQALGVLSRIDPDGLADSMERRRAVAEQIDSVATMERTAAACLEAAVPLMTVHHGRDRTWIDLPGFDTGQYASSVHGAQARILQLLGEPLTYEDLICYSGFAFRLGVHEQMCPSAGHPCCGYLCVGGSQRALPWATRTYTAASWAGDQADRSAFEAEVRAAVKASIDRGVPVHYGSEEDGLIVGYGDGGKRWLCMHPYHQAGRATFWHDEVRGFAGGNWPWGIEVWTEPLAPAERPTDRDLTVAALEQAVAMWRTEKVEAYYCGEAAYAHWLGWLRGVDAGTVTDPAAGMQGNGWCFDVLVHSRRIAGQWLRGKAELFAGEAGEQLRRAADRYARTAAVCAEGLSCPWDLAPGPDRREQWTSQQRQVQAARLEAAREHDRAAAAAVDSALALIKVAP